MASSHTPMMRQYLDIKEQYKDCILFFRLGDFYEMFFEDATLCAKELDLTLTGRGKDENRIAMCGVPHHASEQYISRLIKKGFKVAICEQIEDASESKGITKRDVTRVVTPGTVISDTVIESDSNHYLMAIYAASAGLYGVSFVDNSTGEFKLCSFRSTEQLIRFIQHIDPKECLVDPHLTIELSLNCLSTSTPMSSVDSAKEDFLMHFQLSHLNSFGLAELEPVIPAAWAIITYLKQLHHSDCSHITRCSPFKDSQFMMMDTVTVRNLELVRPLHPDQRQGSLFWVLNQTKTTLGSRLLKQWLKQPLQNQEAIDQRLDCVESLKQDLLSREEIREQLKQVYDLERLLSRIASDYHNPRDLIALKESLQAIYDLAGILSHCDCSRFVEMTDFFEYINDEEHPFNTIISLITAAIEEPAPPSISQVNFLKTTYDPALEELKASFQTIKDWIGTLEAKERQSTGIKTLKVGFNKVFGYFFQVSKGQSQSVPDHYIRKQTLTNAERYITPELKEKETILLHGEEKQLELEQRLYKSLIKTITNHSDLLQECARLVAELDCYQSLASIAQQQHYCRPTFTSQQSHLIDLTDSRHPVLAKQASQNTISNRIFLSEDSHIMLITGPNMAGKSTLMKQVALTVIMAQMGSFVPAKSASLSLVDHVFTRIGASDNLVEGQSTFMVEMTETAYILNNATQHSLVLLDEIGRGTSTYDGMSIAGSVLFHLHNQLKSRCLFATHYHELTQLSAPLSAVCNMSMAIVEDDTGIAFTYELVKGPADKSYGVHVATMAGLPSSVIGQAKEMLASFESGDTICKSVGQLSLF